jgi:hypothetical protein
MAKPVWKAPRRKTTSWLVGGVLILSATTLFMAGPPAAQAVADAFAALFGASPPAADYGEAHPDPRRGGLATASVVVTEMHVGDLFSTRDRFLAGLFISAVPPSFAPVVQVNLTGGSAGAGAAGLSGGLATGDDLRGAAVSPTTGAPFSLQPLSLAVPGPGAALQPATGPVLISPESWPGPKNGEFALTPLPWESDPQHEATSGLPELLADDWGPGPGSSPNTPAVPVPTVDNPVRHPSVISAPASVSLMAIAWLALLAVRHRTRRGAPGLK